MRILTLSRCGGKGNRLGTGSGEEEGGWGKRKEGLWDWLEEG